MNVSFDTANSIYGQSDLIDELPEQEQKRAKEFLKILEQFDALQETPEERSTREAQEVKEAQEKRDKQRRILELRALISQLQQKLAASSYDKSIAAQLSMAQTELFWLMNG